MTVETKPLATQANNDHSLPEGGSWGEEELAPAPLSEDAKKWENKRKGEQSDPPRVGLSKLFPSGEYPEGEVFEYRDDNAWRTTSEEKRYNERLAMEDPEDTYNNIRRAAEVHRQVRRYARRFIRPGMKLLDIAEEIEMSARALVEENGLESGIGFPTGLNINNCAAHYSPNPGDATVLKQGDVLKVDFGIHVKGRILDSAFTLAWDHTYDKLLDAVRDATNTGIRVGIGAPSIWYNTLLIAEALNVQEAGIDVRLGELAGLIQETMESYEVEVGTRTIPVRPIENFSGHSIKPYRIHGGKSLLLVRNDDPTKMEEGEYFAIETFGSTGRGLAFGSGGCSHYAKATDAPNIPLQLNTAKELIKTISKEFGTLTFCRRYLDRIGESNYLLPLNYLVSQGVVRDYPPLMEERGAMTAQFEHTILLRPTVKEVVSRGDDY